MHHEHRTFDQLEHLQKSTSDPPHTSGRAARSLTGHDISTQRGSLNGSQTSGLTGTPHIQPKYGTYMGRPRRIRHVEPMAGSHTESSGNPTVW